MLEGLNAILDHRASIFIPELDRSFNCPPGFRVFACQNPISQGGGRKGLPKSFLNRFTQIYIDPLSFDDYVFILGQSFESLPSELLSKMVTFNSLLLEEVQKGIVGRVGGPWELNLRDLVRWGELMVASQSEEMGWNPGDFLDMIYLQRMRTITDRQEVVKIYNQVFSNAKLSLCSETLTIRPVTDDDEDSTMSSKLKNYNRIRILPSYTQIGGTFLPRDASRPPATSDLSTIHLDPPPLLALPPQLSMAEHVMKCVEMNWMPILIGPAGSGKTSLIRYLAKLSGRVLDVFAMNSSVDTMELLGGYEQVEEGRYRRRVIEILSDVVECLLRCLLLRFYQGEVEGLKRHSNVDATLSAVGEGQVCLDKMNEILDLWRVVRFHHLSSSSTPSSWKVKKEMVLQLFGLIEKTSVSFFIPIPTTPNTQNKQEESETSSSLPSSLFFNHTIHKTCSSSPSLQETKATIQQWADILAEQSVSGKFEWVDGMLLRAMRDGHWLLIDNVNFCAPTVLDRLNPLVEPGGSLIVNERGTLSNGELHVAKPHPNFRLFLTMDAASGEVSRAMRNRGVEMVILPPCSSSAAAGSFFFVFCFHFSPLDLTFFILF